MNIKDIFSKVDDINPDELKELLKTEKPENITILDVRQEKEYEREHIPGAKLIPIMELDKRLDELDPDKPTIAYCAIGGRSRMAASLLGRNGFKSVLNLRGGIKAWRGITAEGPPSLGVVIFKDAFRVEDYLKIAWLMEEGTMIFYKELAGKAENETLRKFYEKLSAEETGHQARIMNMSDNDILSGEIEELQKKNREEKLVEGGLKLEEALYWCNGKSTEDVLNYALAMEVQLFDLYIRLNEKVENKRIKCALETLAGEEKKHFESLWQLMEKTA